MAADVSPGPEQLGELSTLYVGGQSLGKQHDLRRSNSNGDVESEDSAAEAHGDVSNTIAVGQRRGILPHQLHTYLHAVAMGSEKDCKILDKNN